MNRNSLFSGVLGSLRACALGLIIATSAVSIGNAVAQSNTPTSSTPAVKTAPDAPKAVATTGATAPVAAAFDGVPVYNAAFEALRDYHKDLQDPTVRAAFIKTWEHRHDADKTLTTEAGTDKAIFEMMWSLGQRFDYYNLPEATKEEKGRADASLAGIGATLFEKNLGSSIRALGKEPKKEDVLPLFKLSDERPLIVAEDPDSDTPSGKGGVLKGDRITAVDGKDVNGRTLDEVVGTIRGTPGTTVTLSITRTVKGVDQKITLPIVRAKFIIHVVKSTDLGNGITQIKLTHFESQYGVDEMYDALSKASTGKAIILDLRGNPGGEISQPVSMAAMFLNKGIVVQLIQRSDDERVTITHSFTPTNYVGHIVTSGGQDITKQGKRPPLVVPATMPVIVLIDGGSYSASEILSGALQANHRALVVGQPSGGKGVGQTVIPLPNDRNMHVTSFEFRPGAQVMDWIGVVPDVEVVQPEDANTMEDPASDLQLARAKAEAAAAIAGHPTAFRSAVDVAARKAELKKKNEDNFAKEVEMRRKAIATPDVDPNTVETPIDKSGK